MLYIKNGEQTFKRECRMLCLETFFADNAKTWQIYVCIELGQVGTSKF